MLFNLSSHGHKTATFFSAIGKEVLEIYEGMPFNPPESSKVLVEYVV